MMITSFQRNTTGVTGGAGTGSSSEAPVVFSGVRVARSLVFYVIFCSSLFVIVRLFRFVFVLSFPRFKGF